MSTRNGALIVNRPGDRTNCNGTPGLVGLTDATSNVGPVAGDCATKKARPTKNMPTATEQSHVFMRREEHPLIKGRKPPTLVQFLAAPQPQAPRSVLYRSGDRHSHTIERVPDHVERPQVVVAKRQVARHAWQRDPAQQLAGGGVHGDAT